MEISNADWKLFRERITGWQEAYMDRLTKEYITLLSADKIASERFWELEKRIREDKTSPGVQLRLRKADLRIDLLKLLWDKVITPDDLTGFSDDLKDTVLHLYDVYSREDEPDGQ